ncbi:hypothetical protein jhhlp_004835 [Lomentospora prolificans]|uniref:LysM domain-containing protein n=1 Tax=Lomentospora prolificans TaxID=41688 RepID=A0A2N3N7N2_9PEZI|nr:hypothetical protein jhhlp_004835 [Lomentospora prolificans]
MLTPRFVSFLGCIGLIDVASTAAVVPLVSRDGPSPSLNFDPNTTKDCTWWVDLSAAAACSTILAENAITLETFRRWNPSIPAVCGTLQAGNSYCVEAMFETVPTTTKSAAQTSTTSVSVGPTKPPNGIVTPTPIQPHMVDNCNAFYFVESGQNCDFIARANGITFSQLLAWNPSVGSGCAGLWADAYVCVSIIGEDVPTPTTTPPGNGVTTPVPTQDGMATNCNKFHFVQQGQTCATIAALYSISTAQFIQWNPAAKNDCTGLWSQTYACVGLLGTLPPTTTQPGTGVTTPTPTQPGMVNNCKKFTFVNSGTTCAQIASANNISLDDFVRWNAGVGGRDCRDMWAEAYVCIGV